MVDKVIGRQEQIAALDEAVRAIAGIMSVDRTLQLIVDRVRELVDAQYAALGIVDDIGGIGQFITSGISSEQRALIGALPHGRGLLGLLILEGRSFLIDDIATDPRRYGFPPNHPEMHSFLGVPVLSKGVSVGNLYLTNKQSAPTFNEDDLRLVETFALHAGIAIENARLHEDVQRLAVVEERERIAQDMHDSIIQSLYGISLSLEDLPEIMAEDPTEGTLRTDRAIDNIQATIRDLRNFILGLQSELLEGADLAAGIESMAAELRANTLIDVEVAIDELPAIPTEQAAHLLAITREGLSNIARHSGATRAWLEVTTRKGLVRLVIRDNGRGFDTRTLRGADHHGVGNLQARARAAGGSLILTSAAGQGTTLMAEIRPEAED
jgi:signal transduction histidine kinase